MKEPDVTRQSCDGGETRMQAKDTVFRMQNNRIGGLLTSVMSFRAYCLISKSNLTLYGNLIVTGLRILNEPYQLSFNQRLKAASFPIIEGCIELVLEEQCALTTFLPCLLNVSIFVITLIVHCTPFSSHQCQDDPQLIPGELLGGHLPGEALEKCCESFRVRLLLRGSGTCN